MNSLEIDGQEVAISAIKMVMPVKNMGEGKYRLTIYADIGTVHGIEVFHSDEKKLIDMRDNIVQAMRAGHVTSRS